jgi:hypothetical protein
MSVENRLVGSMDRSPALRVSFVYALVMLVAQFMLGMAVNLFVKIPTDHPGSNPPDYFSGVAQSVTWAILHGHILLAVHAGFGLVLVIAAVGTMVQAIQARRRGSIISSVVGFVGVIGAGFNGGSYLNYHEDFSSMLMATGFAVSVVAYSLGLYLAAQPSQTTA